jgi:hypothetical protein
MYAGAWLYICLASSAVPIVAGTPIVKHAVRLRATTHTPIETHATLSRTVVSPQLGWQLTPNRPKA